MQNILYIIPTILCGYVSIWYSCGSRRVASEGRYLEILDFTLFFDHFVFAPNAENILEKVLKKEIPVSVGIELVVVDMSENVDFMG